MQMIPFDAVRAWTFRAALPLWAEAGFDAADGSFFETLTLDGTPTGDRRLRTRTLCRQIYVYAHAQTLGWERGEAVSAAGAQYLLRCAALEGGGWAKALGEGGVVLDPTLDLYDMAFVLFALGWRYRAAKEPEILAAAHATLDFIEARMSDAEGAGYWHVWPPQGHRQQNPHMHLLEASLATFEASGDQRFLDQADTIVELFKRRFFDGETLAEFFTRDWGRAEGEAGRLVEPGHQFEWAWILAQYQRLSGKDVTREAEALVGFAEKFGVDQQSQVTFQQIRDDGAPLDRGSRAWPNTERIKGWLGLYELTGADPRAAAAGSTRLLLDRYFADCAPGAWIDHFDAEGRPISKTAPASTFYHVFLAFAELLRLEPRLSA